MQSRAVYSDKLYPEGQEGGQEELLGERISHYALQSPHYSHTTSPIRRVPDFITQHNILAKIHGTKPIKLDEIENVIENSNKRQLDIDQAEKDFEDISSVIYCEKHIGDKMSGRISKIRYTTPEEGYEDEIVVIVKNDDKGISAEIPLSQVLGRNADDCCLSEQGCAVYDGRGNVVVTLCKPIDFIIDKADRKTMIVVGKTNKELVRGAENRSVDYRHGRHFDSGKAHDKAKQERNKRIRDSATHQYREKGDEE